MSANVDVYKGSGTDGALSIGQNNGAAFGQESTTSFTALNQWQVLTVMSDGSTLSIYRNGHRAIQTSAGTIGGIKGLKTFELLNNPQAGIAFVEVALGAPSPSQHDGEVARLGSECGISVEHVTLGSPTQIAPIAIDLIDDFLTTPIFPLTDQPPVDNNSIGPGRGLLLAPGFSSVMNMYFSEGTKTVNVPDEASLRKYVYMNYFSLNQTQAIGSPIDRATTTLLRQWHATSRCVARIGSLR